MKNFIKFYGVFFIVFIQNYLLSQNVNDTIIKIEYDANTNPIRELTLLNNQVLDINYIDLKGIKRKVNFLDSTVNYCFGKDSLDEFFKENIDWSKVDECKGFVIVSFILEKNEIISNIRIIHEMPFCRYCNTNSIDMLEKTKDCWSNNNDNAVEQLIIIHYDYKYYNNP